ncbi:hypothetical protein ACFOD9_06850 [Novosphingobium bradum]|uniref:Glycosyltransferase RgtA/B/C/D-like domain-containing protein n=1 Tax=Novosphingobium bradum TaxID=1737444 RepID=A0ABV7IPS5_9SPHN
MDHGEGVHAAEPGLAGALGQWLDRQGAWLHGALAGLVLLICAVGAAVFTIDPDEAWILLSTYQVFGLPVAGAGAIDLPTLTTGGPHLLVHGLLGLATRAIIAHRLVSLACLAALLGLVLALMRRQMTERRDAWLGMALVLATPGLLLQGALAMAEIMATLLLLATIIYWDGRGRLSLAGTVLAGVLLGLVCATRANALACVPVFALFALIDRDNWLEGLVRAAALGFAAVATHGLCVAGQAALFPAGNWGKLYEYLSQSTGIGAGKSPWQMLRHFWLAADFFPPLLVIAVLAGLLACQARGAAGLRLPLLMVTLALAGAASWVIAAPIPQVRYAWPFAPLLFVAAGLVLDRSGLLARPRQRLVLHLGVIGLVLLQVAASLIALGTGDSLVATYQANRQAAVTDRSPDWSASRDQQALARRVAALPADARLVTRIQPLGLPITYLSGRRIDDLMPWTPARRPAWLVVTPGDRAVFDPDAALAQWAARNAVPVFRSGEYALYQVVGPEPFPPP